ncbi:tetratricopeptide repeat protein [Streptomyces sp. NPDC046942]|uniref:tetratricopeptide repeat protein n=1 Tax=Streptomyces sp. NPDC046942 TaxID=3155137 RepID=UPI0033F66134
MSRLSFEKKRAQQPAAHPAVVPVRVFDADGASVGGTSVTPAPGEKIQQAVLNHLQRLAISLGAPIRATIQDDRAGLMVPLEVSADGSSRVAGEPVRVAPPGKPTSGAGAAQREEQGMVGVASRGEADAAAPESVAGGASAEGVAGGASVRERGAMSAGTVQMPTGQFGPPPVMSPAPAAIPAPAASPAPAAGTDIPGSEAPKSDAPKSDAPGTDAPGTDVPTIGATKAVIPKSEAPKPEAPKSEAAKPEAAKSEAAKSEAAKSEATKADAPKTGFALLGVPGMSLGEADEPIGSGPVHTPARGFDAVAEEVLGDGPVTETAEGAELLTEPMTRINEAVRAGRIEAAAELAERTVAEAATVLGPGHAEVLHLCELSAYIAYLGGEPVRACRQSLDLARLRRQARDTEAAYGNMQSAATAWRAVRDPEEGLRLGRDLIELWTDLSAEPGPAADDPRPLESARARMVRLTDRAARAAQP